ncbi:MAG: hypothetical protein ACPG7F_00805 [Aggregatilineales bacterium]
MIASHLRLIPALAAEMGLNESIMLCQIAFWICGATDGGNPGIVRDERFWTYQSIDDMRKKAFAFWGRTTINRLVKKLEDAGYITTTTEYNRHKYDRTRWFSLTPDAIALLTLYQIGTSPSRNDTSLYQIGTRQNQIGTTIPENTTKTYMNDDDDDVCSDSDSGEFVVEAEAVIQSDDADNNADTAPDFVVRRNFPVYVALTDAGVDDAIAWRYRMKNHDDVAALIREAKAKANNPAGWVVNGLQHNRLADRQYYAQFALQFQEENILPSDSDATPIMPDLFSAPGGEESHAAPEDDDETEQDYQLPPAAIANNGMATDRVWDAAYDQLRLQLDSQNFNMFLKGATYQGYTDGVYQIRVRNSMAQDRLQHRLYRNVQRVLSDTHGQQVEIQFSAPERMSAGAMFQGMNQGDGVG